jgi:hypothetical protein
VTIGQCLLERLVVLQRLGSTCFPLHLLPEEPRTCRCSSSVGDDLAVDLTRICSMTSARIGDDGAAKNDPPP